MTQPISRLLDKDTSLRFGPSRNKVLRTEKTHQRLVRSRDIQMLTSEKVTSQCVGDIIDLSAEDPFHRSRKRMITENVRAGEIERDCFSFVLLMN